MVGDGAASSETSTQEYAARPSPLTSVAEETWVPRLKIQQYL